MRLEVGSLGQAIARVVMGGGVHADGAFVPLRISVMGWATTLSSVGLNIYVKVRLMTVVIGSKRCDTK